MHWVWATPPDEELRQLGRALGDGDLPEGLDLVKSNRARSVWRLPGVGGGLIVKRFEVGPAEGWAFRLRPSRARREYRVMADFCRRDLPTVRPVAYAERWDSGRLREAWFLGRLVPEARTLADLLAESPPPERPARVEAALQVVSELHGHPYLHRDLHAGNLLAGSDGRLLITDLHSVWRVPCLTHGMRVRNLAEFMFSLRQFVSLDDLASLLRGYAQRHGMEWSRLTSDVARAVDAYERDHVRGRSARCVRRSSQFTVERNEGARVFRQRSYPLELLFADQHPEQEGETLGDAPRSLVRLVGDERGGRVIKHYRTRGLRSVLRQALGWGRGRSAWLGARRLAVLGIPTPEGLALVENPDGSAVLVTRSLRGAEPLREFMLGLRSDTSPARRQRVAWAVGHLFGSLARTGVQHHDLSSKNVMITEEPPIVPRDLRSALPEEGPTLHLIDLDNLRLTRPFSATALTRMLGQLGDVPGWITRTDRLRFLRAYEQVAGRSLPGEVLARAGERTRRRQRRRAARANG